MRGVLFLALFAKLALGDVICTQETQTTKVEVRFEKFGTHDSYRVRETQVTTGLGYTEEQRRNIADIGCSKMGQGLLCSSFVVSAGLTVDEDNKYVFFFSPSDAGTTQHKFLPKNCNFYD